MGMAIFLYVKTLLTEKDRFINLLKVNDHLSFSIDGFLYLRTEENP